MLVQIREFQCWLERYDRERGWDRVHPSQTLVHALEEMGEIARHVLTLEGYKPDNEGETKVRLAEELADCVTFLFKLAYQYDIDMEAALTGNQSKAEERFSVAQGRKEIERYLARQEENLRRIKGDG
jgi:NTP pyrophosphatase (non-canonical NTP hydrolase)